MEKHLSLLGAATDLGQRKPGTELAPSWLRLKGINEALTHNFLSVEDLGDISSRETGSTAHPERTLLDNIVALGRYNKRLCDVVLDELEKENFVLTLGGDHSIALGTLSASLLKYPDAKVIWVDAHADINTPKTSPSGNLHGMPLAYFTRVMTEEKYCSPFSWVPFLNPKNLVYIGLRDVDQGELNHINELGIKNYFAKDVKKMGIHQVMSEVLEYISSDENLTERPKVHLSFDVDGVDPYYFPATGTPVKNGLTLEDGKEIIKELSIHTDLISLDLVEVNPNINESKADLEKTWKSTIELLDSLSVWNERGQIMEELRLRN